MSEIKVYYEKNEDMYQPHLVEELLIKSKTTNDERRRINRYFYHPKGLRKCFVCNSVKEANSENFYVKRYYKDLHGNINNFGLSARCKDCDKIRAAIHRDKVGQNPEKYCSYLTASLKSRAKEQKVPFDLTKEDLFYQLEQQDYLCFYSKEKLDFTLKAYSNKAPHREMPSVDKLTPSKGYVKGNFVWTKYYINRLKSDLNLQEFIELCKKVYKNFGQE